jgi:hypothetical protein
MCPGVCVSMCSPSMCVAQLRFVVYRRDARRFGALFRRLTGADGSDDTVDADALAGGGSVNASGVKRVLDACRVLLVEVSGVCRAH